ncbi:MAG: chemotaxis response regulator protein-glutamate methylesterase [Deltaproteobacteria bacterium]|nr:chemotaxis response regulator protein-glutamate methylesterase [Deltaproteobacteria bacterium]
MIVVLLVAARADARAAARAALESASDIAVCGESGSARDIERLLQKFRPEVIILGSSLGKAVLLEVTERIMQETPTAVVVLEDAGPEVSDQAGFEALQRGAVEIARSPAGVDRARAKRLSAELVDTVRMASRVRLIRRRPVVTPAAKGAGRASAVRALVAIGASTGGPPALVQILSALPAAFSAPILVVQHMTDGFSEQFVSWLSSMVPQRVMIPKSGEVPEPGVVYVGQEGQHLGVNANGTLRVSDDPPLNGHRPAATVLFESLAGSSISNRVGVILTGMGDDGARGLVALRRSGGYVLAQDAASCVVFGMPQAAIALGAANEVAALDDIGPRLLVLMLDDTARQDDQSPGPARRRKRVES